MPRYGLRLVVPRDLTPESRARSDQDGEHSLPRAGINGSGNAFHMNEWLLLHEVDPIVRVLGREPERASVRLTSFRKPDASAFRLIGDSCL